MKAKEFIPASKPRNFVAKNQQTAGAGAHRDKKKEQKQGYEKHKGKGVSEGYTGRETKDGTWRVFKDGKAVAAAGPFKSREEAAAWIKKQKTDVAEGWPDYDDNQYSLTDSTGKELTLLRGNTPEEAIERAKQLIGSNEKLLATFGLVKLTPRPHYIVRNAKSEQGVAEGSEKNVVKSVRVGNFRHDLVDTGFGWQVRIYNGDELYDTGMSKNSEQKGLAALEDAVAYTEKQTRTKRQGVSEGTEATRRQVNLKKKIDKGTATPEQKKEYEALKAKNTGLKPGVAEGIMDTLKGAARELTRDSLQKKIKQAWENTFWPKHIEPALNRIQIDGQPFRRMVLGEPRVIENNRSKNAILKQYTVNIVFPIDPDQWASDEIRYLQAQLHEIENGEWNPKVHGLGLVSFDQPMKSFQYTKGRVPDLVIPVRITSLDINRSLVGEQGVSEGYGQKEFEIGGYTYMTDLDREEDNQKIWHMIKTPDGKTVNVDFTPYAYMSKDDVELYVKLGMPKRQGRGPLDSEQLQKMAQIKGVAMLDPKMARAGM